MTEEKDTVMPVPQDEYGSPMLLLLNRARVPDKPAAAILAMLREQFGKVHVVADFDGIAVFMPSDNDYSDIEFCPPEPGEEPTDEDNELLAVVNTPRVGLGAALVVAMMIEHSDTICELEIANHGDLDMMVAKEQTNETE